MLTDIEATSERNWIDTNVIGGGYPVAEHDDNRRPNLENRTNNLITRVEQWWEGKLG